MRYLGIDYGAKRVGLALSDEQGNFAYPLSVIENTDNLISEISKICKENNVGEIVVGESRNFSQKENDIMREIKPFVKSLEKETSLPVSLHPEFMTSVEAERIQSRRLRSGSRLKRREVKNDMHDASAATLILKHFLGYN